MLVKNTQPNGNLTLGQTYVVIEIYIDPSGEVFYYVLDDNQWQLKEDGSPDYPKTLNYFVPIAFPKRIFEVIDKRVPSSWVTKKTGLFKKKAFTTFPEFMEREALFPRVSDGSEPDRSFFFHKL